MDSAAPGGLGQGPQGRARVCHTSSHISTPGTNVDPSGLHACVPSWSEKGKYLNFKMTLESQKCTESHWQDWVSIPRGQLAFRVPEVITKRDLRNSEQHLSIPGKGMPG